MGMILILAINTVISLIAWNEFKSGDRERASRFLFEPERVVHGENYLGMLLSNFSHSSLSHFIFNMLTFYFFAPAVENRLGMAGMLDVYIVSGLTSTFVVLYLHRNNPQYRSLGASGSVSGIIFGTILLEPSISIYLFLIPIPIPGPVFAVLYIILSYFMMKREGGTISHEAHIAGALGGFFLTAIMSPWGFAPLVNEINRWL